MASHDDYVAGEPFARSFEYGERREDSRGRLRPDGRNPCVIEHPMNTTLTPMENSRKPGAIGLPVSGERKGYKRARLVKRQ
ncbi:hypothetical protein CEXT_311721 [Caerostris extrusa]|uniref:Uncharacterized protein n=1 Tax=Caerostris extrusa TaxID=172846 RepID=A0AAV4P0J7_CAEEX|nr:hypothetical protein CEXT_311721 [Caerostris extrusa]